MTFEEKLNIVLTEMANVYNLSSNEIAIIERNIKKRYDMYKSVKPNINKEETTFIKNTTDVGDVLLNRLINNIRNYSFSREFDSNITTKGSYTAKRQEFKLESPASLRAATLNKLNVRIPNASKETIQKSVVKVFDHELGHALQRAFTGVVGENDTNFNQLISNLVSKYPNIFENKNHGELKTIQGGMIPERREDSKKDIRRYYSASAYSTHLDEIFNDDEATHTVGQDTPQFQYNHGNGLKQNIYNYESSYYRITNYADMMKSLMGKERTYRSMYEDSIEAYEFFDQFINESNQVFANTKYAGHAPMLNVLNAFEEAKNQKSTQALLRLDLFFTMCLQRKVNHELRNPNFDLSNLNEVVALIKNFDSKIVKSDDNRLISEKIISDLKEKVDAKYRELKKLNQQNINNQNTISKEKNQSSYDDTSKELSSTYSDIRKELITINTRYHEIIFDKTIDSNELNELLNRLDTLDKKVMNKQQTVTTETEKKQLDHISEMIYEGKRAMEKAQMNLEQSSTNEIDRKYTV